MGEMDCCSKARVEIEMTGGLQYVANVKVDVNKMEIKLTLNLQVTRATSRRWTLKWLLDDGGLYNARTS